MSLPRRTIPETPIPGERCAAKCEGLGWNVYESYRDGSKCLIATGGLSESDARLLVFGAKAVEALEKMSDCECDGCFCDPCCESIRDALANLKGPR